MYTVAGTTSSNMRPIFSTTPPEEVCAHCHSRSHKKTPIHGADLFFKFQLDLKRRSLWGLNMVAALVASIYFTWAMLMEYVRNTTTTHIGVVQNTSMLLPTVYVCPKNADFMNYSVVFKDVEKRLGYFNYNETRDILVYFIAGSGFQNTDVSDWSQERLLKTEKLFSLWKGGRTMEDLFQFVFDENGITCKDVFKKCTTSGFVLDCCEYFRPSYVMLRGRCMRLKPMMQYGATELNKFILYFATPESRLIDGADQKQFVIYLGDQYPEIAMYPRVYATYNYRGRLKLTAREVHMIKRPEVCNSDPNYQGRYTCFVNRWLQENLIERFNCTLPYLTNVRAAIGYEVCEPGIIVRNYDFLLNATLSKYKCILNCDRWDLLFKYTTKKDPTEQELFSMEIYYPDIYYEVYSEIQMTSMPGFISQVGGQVVLFLGTSIISVVYISISMAHRLKALYAKISMKRLAISPIPGELDNNSNGIVLSNIERINE